MKTLLAISNANDHAIRSLSRGLAVSVLVMIILVLIINLCRQPPEIQKSSKSYQSIIIKHDYKVNKRRSEIIP